LFLAPAVFSSVIGMPHSPHGARRSETLVARFPGSATGDRTIFFPFSNNCSCQTQASSPVLPTCRDPDTRSPGLQVPLKLVFAPALAAPDWRFLNPCMTISVARAFSCHPRDRSTCLFCPTALMDRCESVYHSSSSGILPAAQINQPVPADRSRTVTLRPLPVPRGSHRLHVPLPYLAPAHEDGVFSYDESSGPYQNLTKYL